MKFSKTTSYAITVLCYMADHEKELLSAKELHEKLEIPWHYLRNLMTNLSKKGLVKSFQGRNGGFLLEKSSEKIILREIVDAVEDLNVLDTCIMGFKVCPFDNKCPMHETWVETGNNIIKILNRTTLSQLKNSK